MSLIDDVHLLLGTHRSVGNLFSKVTNVVYLTVGCSIDLSQNPNLELVIANDNFVLNFNIQNGNNSIIESFSSQMNPGLVCLQVDDEQAANNGEAPYTFWLIDEQTGYSENCPLLDVEDEKTEVAVIYPNPASSSFSIITTNRQPVANVSIFDLNGRLMGAPFNAETQSVDVSLLAKGTYLYKINFEESETEVGKLIKR